jgi:hypothetical protein
MFGRGLAAESGFGTIHVADSRRFHRLSVSWWPRIRLAGGAMGLSFEQAIILVWRQALVENVSVVALGADGRVGEEGDAVPPPGPIRGECGRWEDDAVR